MQEWNGLKKTLVRDDIIFDVKQITYRNYTFYGKKCSILNCKACLDNGDNLYNIRVSHNAFTCLNEFDRVFCEKHIKSIFAIDLDNDTEEPVNIVKQSLEKLHEKIGEDE